MFKTLVVLTIFASLFSGKRASQSYSDRAYWRAMILPIFCFTVLYGCRYGWLYDFNLYETTYNASDDEYLREKMGWLSYFLFREGHTIGLSYNCIIAFLSLSLIVCFSWFVKPYKEHAAWYIPIFILTNYQCANFILFYPAIGAFAVFMSLHLQCENKYNILKRDPCLWTAITFLFIAYGYHHAVILALAIYVLGLLLHIKKSLYAVLVYGISFAFQQDEWIRLLNYVNMYVDLSGNESFSIYDSYISNADNFFSSHRSGIVDYGHSFFFIARTFVSNAIALWLYFKYREENKLTNDKVFEFATIALVLTNMTEGVEVLHRYAMLFRVFMPVLYVYAFYYGIRSEKTSYKLLAWTFLLIRGESILMDFIKIDSTDFKYIWDLM